jgi:hypothetical protein
MELLQLGFCSLDSRCNRPGRGGRRKRRGSGSGRKKIDRVSPGFDRVDRVPGRPAGLTGFSRANFQTGFCLHLDRSQARVGRVPGRPVGPVRVLKHCFKCHHLHDKYLLKQRKEKKRRGLRACANDKKKQLFLTNNVK